MLIQGKVDYGFKSLNPKSLLKKMPRQRIETYLKKKKSIFIFSFLLHALNMPWFLALVISTPLPFMNCSIFQRLEFHNVSTVNILATFLPVHFAGKIIDLLGCDLLSKSYSRYQLICFFFCLWGNHPFLGIFSRVTDLGRPLHLFTVVRTRPWKLSELKESLKCAG